MSWVKAAATASVAPGTVRVVEIEGRRIALCNAGGDIYAIDDVCTHDGAPLDQGELEGAVIECPRHGARFDVTTGRALALPAVRPLRTYPVRHQNGDVAVEVD